MKFSTTHILLFVISTLAPLYAQSTPGLEGKKGEDFRPNLLAVLGEDRGRTWGLPLRLEIDPNRNKLYLTESFGEISIFDCETLNRLKSFTAHTQRCLDVALVDDGKQLVSVATDGSIRLWDLQTAQPTLLDTYAMTNSDEPVWLKISRAFKSKLFAVRSDKQLGLFEIRGDKIAFRSDARARNKKVPYVFGLSPDGRWMVTSETLETSEIIEADGSSYSYFDAKLFLWDLAEQKPKPTFITNCKAIEALYFLNDSQFVTETPHFVPNRNSQAWSIVNGQLRIDSEETAGATIFGEAAVSQNGLAKAVTTNGIVSVFERRSDKWIERGKLDEKQVISMAFHGDDLITCSGPVLKRWRWQGGKYQQMPSPIGHCERVAKIDFDRHGRGLVSTGDSGALKWSVTEGRYANLTPVSLTDDLTLKQFDYEPVERSMSSIRSLPSGNHVLFGRLLDEQQNEAHFKIDFGTDYRKACWSVAVHPSRAIVATGHWDSTIRLWEISKTVEPKMLAEWKAHNGHVCAVIFSPDGTCIGSAGWDNLTKIWNINYETMGATAGPLLDNRANTNIVRRVVYSPSGRFLASAGEDGLILLWDLKSGKLEPEVLSYPDKIAKSHLIDKTIDSLQFSKAEDKLLSASGGGRVTQWNTSTGQIAHSWQLPGWVWQARYSPDEKSIATANNDGTIYILKNPLSK